MHMAAEPQVSVKIESAPVTDLAMPGHWFMNFYFISVLFPPRPDLCDLTARSVEHEKV